MLYKVMKNSGFTDPRRYCEIPTVPGSDECHKTGVLTEQNEITFRFDYEGRVPVGTVFQVRRNNSYMVTQEITAVIERFTHTFTLDSIAPGDVVMVELYDPGAECILYQELYHVQKERHKLPVLPVVLLLILIPVVFLFGSIMKGEDTPVIAPTITPTQSPTPPKQDTILDIPTNPEENQNPTEYTPEEIKEALTELQNNCSINATKHLKLKTVKDYGVLELSNPNNFHVQVSILPYDENYTETEPIENLDNTYFTSMLLGPGDEMYRIRLDSNLDKLKEGEQPVWLYCNCYQLSYDKYTYLGAFGMKITLEIESLEDNKN